MVKKISLILIVLIAGVLIYAATKPDTFRVERAASINAPPEKIFALIDDFHRWDAWSPWENKDPAMKRAFGAVTRGKGAVYQWDGNNEVGTGRMEITEWFPPSQVVIQLDFVKPFEAHNMVQFTLESYGDATTVTWAMQGHTPYFAKVIHVFMDMDSMVGGNFETGLTNLKTIAEQ